MKSIFIIGATGKVGGAAIAHLTQFDDIHVIAGVRDPDAARVKLPTSVELREFNLDDRTTIDASLAGVDSLLLMTGYTVDMMKQSKRVIDAAKANSVGHIVHVGASGNPTSEVAHWGWHQMIQAYIKQSGVSHTFLQPEAFMQNIEAFGWYDGASLTNLIGDCVWSWVSADDVGALAAEALRRSQDFAGQTWQLGYEAASMSDVAAMLSAKTAHDVHLTPLAPQAFYDAAVAGGGDPAYMTCIRDLFEMNAAGEIADTDATFDAAAFEAAVGRPPMAWADYLETLSARATA